MLKTGLAFSRTQPRSGPNPARESQYFGSDRVETSSIRSDIGPKIGRTWDTLDRVRLEPPKSRIGYRSDWVWDRIIRLSGNVNMWRECAIRKRVSKVSRHIWKCDRIMNIKGYKTQLPVTINPVWHWRNPQSIWSGRIVQWRYEVRVTRLVPCLSLTLIGPYRILTRIRSGTIFSGLTSKPEEVGFGSVERQTRLRSDRMPTLIQSCMGYSY